MCAVQLSHVFKGANKYSPMASFARRGSPGAAEFRVLAELALDVKFILTPPCIFH
jgi:hypothetical protein